MNPIKPLLMYAVFLAWGWFASTRVDKWLEYHYLPRQTWNGAVVGSAALGLVVMLLIPIFWVGLPVAMLVIAGTFFAYIQYHNAKVRPEQRISMNLTQKYAEAREQHHREKAQRDAPLIFLEPDGTHRAIPDPESSRAKVHQKLAAILGYAMPRGAERLVIGVSGSQAVVMIFIDSARYVLPGFDPKFGVAMIDYLKSQAALDLEERRRKQVGDAHFTLNDGRNHMLRITTVGSTREISLTAVIDPAKAVSMPYTELGLLGVQVEQLQPVFERNTGIVLVASPARHGQTTTLYSLIQRHDPYMQSIITLEDDIALELEGITHNAIESSDNEASVAKRLQTLIRQDPGVIMLSRPFGAQVAQMAISGADETRFYFGLRADDTFSALRQWIKLMGGASAAAEKLDAIVAQRLVRKLCTTCRVSYTPDAGTLKKLNLGTDRAGRFYKHSGKVMVDRKPQTCPDCHGLGYSGRIGVYEVMVLDDAARQLVAANELDQLRSHLRKRKMLWLQEAGVFKAVDGQTSLSEIGRALGKESDRPIALPASVLEEE
ncbi:MAG: Flp pilus assembly complex ATPase component TadA [Phycisphaeraceae bacterium]|nr:Flp pilus assembly complex ATPase component TadA [Phycisphaeraceae bacterium]